MSVELAVLVVALGALVGFLAGLFGVGGGVIMVPFLVFALDKTQHVAEGTSLAVIVPTAIAGVIVHIRHRNVDLRIGVWLALGGVAGAYLGAGFALALEADTLRIVFAVFVAGMSIRYIVEGLRDPRS
jgi:uncharacterized membrane protein YfcA